MGEFLVGGCGTPSTGSRPNLTAGGCPNFASRTLAALKSNLITCFRAALPIGNSVRLVSGLMEERRTNPRLRTLKGGIILYGAAPSFDCTVRNVSESGALLVVSPVGIPDEFILVIKPEMIRRSCRVIWRSADKIGVRFV